MSTKNSNIRIIKSNSIDDMEIKINNLLKIGYKLWGEMKIDFDKTTNSYVYHQLLSFDKSIYQKQNYSWSDWE